jgi:hypothetical protein
MAKRVSDQQFAESRHRYRDPRSGERVISVTSVVGAFDPSGNKLGAGAGAAVKIALAGGDYRKEWSDKASTGTRVHGYVGKWAEGKTADVLEKDDQFVDAFQDFCRVKKPEWMFTERSVVSSHGYGGKFDLVGWFDDAFWLLDAKSGKEYKTELLLQLAGYARADGLLLYDEEGWAKDIDPMPHIDRWGGLYLAGDGSWKLSEVDLPGEDESKTIQQVQDEAFAAFLHVLEAKKWAASRPK